MASPEISSCTISSSSQSIIPMAIPSTLPSISIKLDRSNYMFWKSQILPAARAHDLEVFLLSPKPKPDEFIVDSTNSNVLLTNPDYRSWIRLDQFVMSWLLSSISKQMLGHVVHCQSVVEVWIVLEQLFSTKSKTRALQLHLSLQTLKKGNGSTEDLNLTLGESVTLQEVQYMLQTHEMRLESLNTTTMVELSHSIAHFVHKQFSLTSHFRGPQRDRYNRGGEGRFSSNGGHSYNITNTLNEPVSNVWKKQAIQL